MRLCYHFALVSTTFFPEAMPHSAANPVPRFRRHTRNVRFEGCARADAMSHRPRAAPFHPPCQREAKAAAD
jgi:hypothetical protein